LGHLPRTGEAVRLDPFVATVAQADDRRVLQVHFRRETAA
jgi:Mg2+/Co2+ transporter CorC